MNRLVDGEAVRLLAVAVIRRARQDLECPALSVRVRDDARRFLEDGAAGWSDLVGLNREAIRHALVQQRSTPDQAPDLDDDDPEPSAALAPDDE